MLIVALGLGSAACEPTLKVGEWMCPAPVIDADAAPAATKPITVPWSTGFENRFCDWDQIGASCYDNPGAHTIVSSPPPHSGRFAAAFTVTGRAGMVGQTRCHVYGVFPDEAYYGAWYYIPATATNTGNWNLFHFFGVSLSEPNAPGHGLWDVSLVNGANGKLNTRVFNFMRGTFADGAPVPIGSWFRLVFHFKRAKDSSGVVALYQDDPSTGPGHELVRVAQFINQSTDDTDSCDWYVGNLATSLVPAESVLYVDDVTISSTLE